MMGTGNDKNPEQRLGVSDDGKFHADRPTSEAVASEYACGMYVFEKKAEPTSD